MLVFGWLLPFREEIRIFRIDRIKALALTDESFQLPGIFPFRNTLKIVGNWEKESQ
jgi:predicted DNA-binding transcriptional regulator YafY